MNVTDLVIEVTRRCNMNCAHCLRGDAQDKDANIEDIRALLDCIETVGTITFTGGEPSLVPELLEQILAELKDRDIPIEGFYIVTNGKEVSDRFLHCLVSFYSYVLECHGEPELCGVALSKDKYHEQIRRENEWKLMSLAFFSKDKYTDFDKWGPIAIGRAASLPGARNRPFIHTLDVSKYENGTAGEPEYSIDDMLMLTVDGDLLAECDYAYGHESESRVGSVKNGGMKHFMKYLEHVATN